MIVNVEVSVFVGISVFAIVGTVVGNSFCMDPHPFVNSRIEMNVAIDTDDLIFFIFSS